MDSPDCLSTLDIWEDEEENGISTLNKRPVSRSMRNISAKPENICRRVWKRKLNKATINGNLREVKSLLGCTGSSRDCDILWGLNLTKSDEMARVYFEAAPDLIGSSQAALVSAAENGCGWLLRELLAGGLSADEPSTWKPVRPLHAACLHDHAACVRLLLEYGGDVERKMDYDLRPMHFAITGRSLECVELLLEQKADVLAKAEGGRQPIHYAADRGATDIVRMLVMYGADINAKDEHNNSPIIYAARGGNMGLPYLFSNFKSSVKGDHFQCFKTLIELGADISLYGGNGYSAFLEAIAWGQTNLVRYLADGIVDVLERTTDEETALHIAARCSNNECLVILLSAGLDVNGRRNDGRTPLHLAVQYWQPENVKNLISFGADVNLVDNEGWSALHIAARFGQIDTIRYLLDVGCNITVTTVDGSTPLHLAASNNNVDAVVALLEQGADVNARMVNGKTPIHLAAENWSIDSLEELLKRGAHIYARDDSGWTALHFAANLGVVETIKFLLLQGFDVAARTNEGKTALHLCVTRGNVQGVQELVRLKAPVNAQDDAGRTALHYAARGTDDWLPRMLLLDGADRTARDNEGNTPADLAINLDVQRLIRRWAIAA